MKKWHKIALAILAVLTIAIIWFWPVTKALYSIAKSYVTTPDYKYIEGQLWQYDKGYKIGEGDFIQFDTRYYVLHTDTIIRLDTSKALIIRANPYFNTIDIRSLTTGETGTYIDINKEMSK